MQFTVLFSDGHAFPPSAAGVMMSLSKTATGLPFAPAGTPLGGSVSVTHMPRLAVGQGLVALHPETLQLTGVATDVIWVAVAFVMVSNGAAVVWSGAGVVVTFVATTAAVDISVVAFDTNAAVLKVAFAPTAALGT